MVSSAAHRRVCSPLGVFAARVTQVVALVFFLASSAPAAGLGNPPAPASSDTVLFSASLDLLTGKEVIKDHAQASPTAPAQQPPVPQQGDRKSTRLNSSHVAISYAVFCLKKKKKKKK